MGEILQSPMVLFIITLPYNSKTINSKDFIIYTYAFAMKSIIVHTILIQYFTLMLKGNLY